MATLVCAVTINAFNPISKIRRHAEGRPRARRFLQTSVQRVFEQRLELRQML
jgi:hypothetical protein